MPASVPSGGAAPAPSAKRKRVLRGVAAAIIVAAVAAGVFRMTRPGTDDVATQFMEAWVSADIPALTETLSPESQRYMAVPAVKESVERMCGYVAGQELEFEIRDATTRGRRADVAVVLRAPSGESIERTIVLERAGTGWSVELLGTVKALTGQDLGDAITSFVTERAGPTGPTPEGGP